MADLLVDDPYTLAEAARVPLAGSAEVDRILDAATGAARAWARSGIDERVAVCLRAVEGMETSRDAIAADVTRMMGKPLAQARGEVSGMAKRARSMASIAGSALADVVLEPEPGRERRIARVPHGVVFSLPAWNYPLLTAVNVVLPAVLSGNAVVLKHSPRSPLVGRKHFARAFAAAGAPAGLLQALHCRPIPTAASAWLARRARRPRGLHRIGPRRPSRLRRRRGQPVRRGRPGARRQGPGLRRRRRRLLPRPSEGITSTAPVTTPARAAARWSASTSTARSTSASSRPRSR